MSFVIDKADDFTYILRVLNTNLNGKRRVPFALKEIKGVGRRFAHIICKVGRIDPKKRAGELTEAETKKISDVIADPEGYGVPKYLLNRQFDFKDGNNYQLASNSLDTKLREDLERMKKIRAHRGLRHYWGLKSRG